MKLKNLFAVAIASLCCCSLSAKEAEELDYKPYPHMFIGIQGGAQSTLTSYDFGKLITPYAGISFGAHFTPIVGARIHASGMWNKGGLKSIEQTYEYKYATTNLDLLLNLCTLFGSKNYYPVNLYAIGGVGFNAAWGNDDAVVLNALTEELPLAWTGTEYNHNFRLGLMLDVPLHKNVSINLEVDANSLGDKYNSKCSGTEDWSITAALGLAFKFGHKKVEKAPVEEWATRIDTIWYEEPAFKERVEDGTISWNVFYEIRESDFNDPEAKLAAIGAFLANHRECKVSIKSYADVQTGNPKINMGYSQQRSEKAVKALVEAGVDPAIITAEYFGDTVQPFAENDKNRVSIITATGLMDVKDRITIKKFRTEEVQYQVK